MYSATWQNIWYFREIQGSQISDCNSPRSEPDLISEPSGCSFDIILLLSLFGLINYCFFGETRPGLWACVGTWYNSISISILPKDDFEKPPVASMNYTYHQKKKFQKLSREFIPLIKGFRCCWWFCPLKKMEFSFERSPPPFFLSLRFWPTARWDALEPRKLGWKSLPNWVWANEQDMFFFFSNPKWQAKLCNWLGVSMVTCKFGRWKSSETFFFPRFMSKWVRCNR